MWTNCLHWFKLRQFTSCGQNVHMRWAVTQRFFWWMTLCVIHNINWPFWPVDVRCAALPAWLSSPLSAAFSGSLLRGHRRVSHADGHAVFKVRCWFGNKKSPHNNLNLTIPSGMALVRVRYVAIRKSKTCSGSFRSRAGTLGKYVILNCWDRLPQKSSRVNKKFWKYATFGRVQENTRETLAKRERAGRCQPSWHDSRKTQKDFRNFEL